MKISRVAAAAVPAPLPVLLAGLLTGLLAACGDGAGQIVIRFRRAFHSTRRGCPGHDREDFFVLSRQKPFVIIRSFMIRPRAALASRHPALSAPMDSTALHWTNWYK